MKVCIEHGCYELTNTTRCEDHTRVRDRARGTRQQRGYDADYDRQRKRIAQAMSNGQVFTCWRCGDVVFPHQLSLGHCDDDRSVIHGAEHLEQCNLANTRGGCPHPSHRN
ncbi:hypothetical protein JCM18899A_18650 [Nocardioides sp. AN3]